MLMTNFLKNRRSTREFKKKKVHSDTLEKINSYLDKLENKEIKGNIKLNLYENGEFIYEKLKGIGGYVGIMIESPHYIGLEQLNMNKSSTIYGAYYMEKLITDLNELGLDTCWVGIGNLEKGSKKEIFKDLEGEMNYLLAIGYSKPKNPFANQPFSERMGVEELVFSEEMEKKIDQEELENRGLEDLFYYIRFAPSKANLQPWRFLLEKDKVTLLIKYEEGEKPNYVDAGIVMYYFEELGKSVGINEKWKLIEGTYEGKEGKYEYVGEIKL